MRARELLSRVKRLEPPPAPRKLPFDLSRLDRNELRLLVGGLDALKLAGCLMPKAEGGTRLVLPPVPCELAPLAESVTRLLRKCWIGTGLDATSRLGGWPSASLRAATDRDSNRNQPL